ncbi:hypothetical protein A4G26_26655 [Mycobacterium kansasii]|nr:hypothetical protein A4G26_26655 [Mycobacterium kansasii]
MFWPKKFVAISVCSKLRLAATTGGGTVIACAVSKAAAAARACIPVSSAFLAVALIQSWCGTTAATMAIDAGPNHCELASSEITDT